MKEYNYGQLVKVFNSEKEQIITKIKDEDYEIKGVLFSEAVFVYLVSKELGNINKIIESGRARAQSTTLFARLFPNNKIVTVEYDKNSPDVLVADKRLSEYKNVSTIYGDSFVEIPKILQKDDIVFIDGPKQFQAIILALKLLGSKKPLAVFLHDTSFNTRERLFINLFFKNSLNSDNIYLSSHTKILDKQIENTIVKDFTFEKNKDSEFGYGYNITCLLAEEKNYKIYIFIAKMFEFLFKVKGKIVRIIR